MTITVDDRIMEEHNLGNFIVDDEFYPIIRNLRTDVKSERRLTRSDELHWTKVNSGKWTSSSKLSNLTSFLDILERSL